MTLKFLFTLVALTLIYSCEKDVAIDNFKILSHQGISESTYKLAKLIQDEVKSEEFRSYLYTQISKKFDGDYNVLINNILDQRSDFQSKIRELNIKPDPLLQIAIPKNFKQISLKNVPDIYLVPNLPENDIPAIYILKNGNLIKHAKTDIPEEPVLVFSMNERVFYSPDDGTYSIDSSYLYFDSLMESTGDIHTRGSLPNGPCNYGRDGDMYLVGLRSPNLGGIEGWFSGKPELRLNALASENEYLAQQGIGNNVMETFYKPKRGDINPGWHYVNDYLFYWPETYPRAITFKWVEEDGGVFSQDTETITVEFASQTYSVTCPEFLKSDHDVIHIINVPMGNYCNFDYGNPLLYYKLAKYDH